MHAKLKEDLRALVSEISEIDSIPDDATFTVLASLRGSAAEGVDRIAELIWKRAPGDPR